MTTQSRPGDPTLDGISSVTSKADHQHGRESWATFAANLNYFSSGTGGSGIDLSRGDHRHGWPVASPRGINTWNGIAANSSPVITETAVPGLGVTAATLGSRLMKVTFAGRVNTTAAGDLVRVRIRVGVDESGTEVARGQRRLAVSGGSGQETLNFFAFVVVNGLVDFVATIERAAGTGNVLVAAETTSPAWLMVEDVGG